MNFRILFPTRCLERREEEDARVTDFLVRKTALFISFALTPDRDNIGDECDEYYYRLRARPASVQHRWTDTRLFEKHQPGGERRTILPSPSCPSRSGTLDKFEPGQDEHQNLRHLSTRFPRSCTQIAEEQSKQPRLDPPGTGEAALYADLYVTLLDEIHSQLNSAAKQVNGDALCFARLVI